MLSTRVDPELGVGLDRVLGDGQHDHRHVDAGLVELLDELGTLDPALQERIDEDDVRAKLSDLGRGLAAIAQDVEQFHRLLRVQQAPDVLGDLRHVLDDEEARLVSTGRARHGTRRYHGPR